jgi:Uma2 family endonuclease
MAVVARRPATLADLEQLPATWRGEIIDGELYASPRPNAIHSNVETACAEDLRGPFHRGRGGPGGWWILVEPGITVPESPEFSPDLGGWKRDRLPRLPEGTRIDVVPDWVCEVHSRSTRAYDLAVKHPFYARIGVRWSWYVDTEARVLTVSRLEESKWIEHAVHAGDVRVRFEPFDAIEIDLGSWWEQPPGEP